MIAVIGVAVAASEERKPVISPETQRDYFKALWDMQAKQQAADAATGAVRELLDKMRKDCGEYQLTQDAKNNPVCGEKIPKETPDAKK